jgi:hypothetical protein
MNEVPPLENEAGVEDLPSPWKEVRREGHYRSRVSSHSSSVFERVQACSSAVESFRA